MQPSVCYDTYFENFLPDQKRKKSIRQRQLFYFFLNFRESGNLFCYSSFTAQIQAGNITTEEEYMSKLAYFLGGIATGVIGLTAAALLSDNYGCWSGSSEAQDAKRTSGNTSEEDGWDEETATSSAGSHDQPETAETASA
jgi:hypothetical protein